MAGMLSLARRGRPSLTVERGDRASTVSFPGAGGADRDDDGDLDEGGDGGVLVVGSLQESREAATVSVATAGRSTLRAIAPP
jgi:hypothetical protein